MPRENAETEREMGLHFPAGGQEKKEKKTPKKRKKKKITPNGGHRLVDRLGQSPAFPHFLFPLSLSFFVSIFASFFLVSFLFCSSIKKNYRVFYFCLFFQFNSIVESSIECPELIFYWKRLPGFFC